MRNEPKIVNVNDLSGMSDSERSDELFSGRARFIGSVSAWAKANPQKYEAAKNLKGVTSPRDLLRSERARLDTPRQYSEAELAARSKFSEADVNDWYAGRRGDLAKFKVEHPSDYAELRISAASWGKIGASVDQVLGEQPKPVTGASSEMLLVTDEMSKELNLPPTTLLTRVGFDRAVNALALKKADAIMAAEQAKQAAEAAAK